MARPRQCVPATGCASTPSTGTRAVSRAPSGRARARRAEHPGVAPHDWVRLDVQLVSPGLSPGNSSAYIVRMLARCGWRAERRVGSISILVLAHDELSVEQRASGDVCRPLGTSRRRALVPGLCPGRPRTAPERGELSIERTRPMTGRTSDRCRAHTSGAEPRQHLTMLARGGRTGELSVEWHAPGAERRRLGAPRGRALAPGLCPGHRGAAPSAAG